MVETRVGSTDKTPPFSCTAFSKSMHLSQSFLVRAVGAANGRNPLPIVLPCHRVIGNDGSLTGFGGGLPTKAALLQLEGTGNDGRRSGDLFR